MFSVLKKTGNVYNLREARLCDHFCRGKAIITKYSGCVSLFLPYVPDLQITFFFLRDLVLSSLACIYIYNNFPHCLKKAQFSERKLLNIKFIF